MGYRGGCEGEEPVDLAASLSRDRAGSGSDVTGAFLNMEAREIGRARPAPWMLDPVSRMLSRRRTAPRPSFSQRKASVQRGALTRTQRAGG